MWKNFCHCITKSQSSFIKLICFFFVFFLIFIRGENQINLMNQNYVNHNAGFLRQEWKNVYTFKGWFNSFSDAFQFMISEVCSIQRNYPVFMIRWHTSLLLSRKYQNNKTFPQGSFSSLTKLCRRLRAMS